MPRPPYLVRVGVGAAVFVLEETRKLPATALSLPVAAFSQMLQTAMHFQQFISSLAIKGDRVLGQFGPVSEQPEWATFDEDLTIPEPAPAHTEPPGRFALYSTPTPAAAAPSPTAAAAERSRGAARAAATGPKTAQQAATSPKQEPPAEPPIVAELDYASLTLAQLRARLKALPVEDMTALLDYEKATLHRAPFTTMLANRISAAKAK